MRHVGGRRLVRLGANDGVAKDVEILVGTSAGSVLASLVACGVSTDELIAHYQDEQVTKGLSPGIDGIRIDRRT